MFQIRFKLCTRSRSLQLWLAQAMGSSDFFYGMTAFSFSSSRSSITLAMAPLLIVAVRSVNARASRQLPLPLS